MSLSLPLGSSQQGGGTQSDPFSLELLEDLALPAAPPWWPPSPIWWALLLIAAAWSIAGGYAYYRRWRSSAHRRAALQELTELEERLKDRQGCNGALADLSSLLKRVALVSYGREEVASLTGESWMAYLDKALPKEEALFARAPCNVLARASSLTNGDPLIAQDEIEDVVKASRRWVREHRASVAPDASPTSSGRAAAGC